MFIKAIKVEFLEDVKLDMTFKDGKIIRYDMSCVFDKFPQLRELREDRQLFLSGHLDKGGYGIIWNDQLDFSAMSIYAGGEIVGEKEHTLSESIGTLLLKTREDLNLTQIDLAKLANVDQADISKIEKGTGNPTLGKLEKIFKSIGKKIIISIE